MLAFHINVEAAQSLQEIESIYKSGKVQLAYQMSQQLLADKEGDPEFDFLYGKVAIDSGNVSQGVFALERVLLLQPDHIIARLELARGYYLLGEFDLAEQSFALVEAMPNIPQLAREKIEQYRQAIENKQLGYQTKKSVYAQLKLGYDSNVNSATAESTFSTPTLGSGSFDDESLAKEAGFYEVDLGAGITHPLDKQTLLFARASLNHRRNGNQAGFDLDTLGLRGGLNITNKDHLYRISASAQHTELDHDAYRHLFTLTAEYQLKLNDLTRLNTYVQAGTVIYPNLDDRDVYSLSTGIGMTRVFKHPLQPVFNLMLFGGADIPHIDNETASAVAEKENLGMSMSLRVKPAKDWSLDISGIWQNSHYQGEDSTFLVKRQDDYYKLGLQASKRLGKSTRLLFGASYSQVSSNISIYEYEREQVYTGIRYDY